MSVSAKWTAVRRDIHAHPELAFAEHRTAALVVSHLKALNLEVHEGLGGTGVVGMLRKGNSSRSIGLRADMDALPIAERNGFEYRSQQQGCMHACGHDGHVAMLLGAAEALVSADFDGTVCFIFQPAEEGAGGARAMIEAGLLERFPVQAVFGMHNWPGLPAGRFAVHTGPVMAGTDQLDIVVTGRGAHAAMPHLGADPIIAAASLVQNLQTIVSRNIAPADSAVLSVTGFHAGDTYNVIPERAELYGTIRFFDQAVRRALRERAEQICHGTATALNVQIDCAWHEGYPPTLNTVAEAALATRIATMASDQPVITDAPPSMGAEDFAYFLAQKPGAYIWLGNGLKSPLHSPDYDFNDEIIPIGIAYWKALVLRFLG